MVRDILASAGGAVEDKLYVEDVFSTYLYTGNGATQTINNGIDLAGKGGMVWLKGRSSASAHYLYDTARGSYVLQSHLADAQVLGGTFTYNANGFITAGAGATDAGGTTYASWTFRKAPKFFDIVTYTGNGVAGRQIPHDLGCEVGMMIVKGTNATSTDWAVYHKSHGNIGGAQLNMTTAFFTQSGWWNNTTPTSNSFTVGTNYSVNTLGTTYVAYLYAHDTSADGMIQCGSFTTDGGGNATVNLGWEPQYLLTKSVGFSDNWYILDDKRGFPVASASTKILVPNSMSSESTSTGDFLNPTSTGFTVLPSAFGSTQTHIYLAIRRPMKVPTSGTEVYNAIARTGTGAAATVTGVGFAPDFTLIRERVSNNQSTVFDKMRGRSLSLTTNSTVRDAVTTTTTNDLVSFDMLGITLGANQQQSVNSSGGSYINHFFKRAKGFFDNFCWTGTGVNRTIAHNLGVAPELLILKSRSAAGDWQVWFSGLASNEKLVLNSTAAKVTDATLLNSTLPTSTLISLGTQAAVNTSSATYVGYAFSSLAGVQKIGTYVGNGTTQNLNFGFSAGARFFLCKAITTTGSYWVFDSVRGIVASTDFGLQLNSTTAEIISADCVDPFVGGISVVEEATCHLNTNGVTYMYWAIA